MAQAAKQQPMPDAVEALWVRDALGWSTRRAEAIFGTLCKEIGNSHAGAHTARTTAAVANKLG